MLVSLFLFILLFEFLENFQFFVWGKTISCFNRDAFSSGQLKKKWIIKTFLLSVFQFSAIKRGKFLYLFIFSEIFCVCVCSYTNWNASKIKDYTFVLLFTSFEDGRMTYAESNRWRDSVAVAAVECVQRFTVEWLLGPERWDILPTRWKVVQLYLWQQ